MPPISHFSAIEPAEMIDVLRQVLPLTNAVILAGFNLRSWTQVSQADWFNTGRLNQFQLAHMRHTAGDIISTRRSKKDASTGNNRPFPQIPDILARDPAKAIVQPEAKS